MSSIKQAVEYAFDGKVSEMGNEINSALMQKVADMIMGKRQEVAQNLVTGVTEEGYSEESSSGVDEEVEELDELCNKTLGSYVKKNVEDTMYKNWDDIPKNRKEGLKKASEKLKKPETNEDVIDEMITRRTLQSYKKPDKYLATRPKKRLRKYTV